MKVRFPSALLMCVCCALLLLALPISLFAHAVLVQSTPQAGSKVKGPDVSIQLKFNVRIDGVRSRCTLVGPDGQKKGVALESQPQPDVLAGKAAGLLPGAYKLQWQVLAADGHISRGEFTFNVE